MGFFKDFKDDFSQAVNELMPGEDSFETDDDLLVNTLEGEVDVASELSKLDGLLEQVSRQETTKNVQRKPTPAAQPQPTPVVKEVKPEPIPTPVTQQAVSQPVVQQAPVRQQTVSQPIRKQAAEPTVPEMEENTVKRTIQEERKMADNTMNMANQENFISDEVSVITQGTVIKGDIISNGALDIQGQVQGNIACNGKLVVTGMVNGNSNASEFFADAAQIEGEVVSTGTVKIGLGSVIIGNVTSSSAVIAGAIKGDIDVQGPVVVDTSAVVMGNIKSRSVQINNGAVIEGFCSQCYSEVDVQSLFESKKGTVE